PAKSPVTDHQESLRATGLSTAIPPAKPRMAGESAARTGRRTARGVACACRWLSAAGSEAARAIGAGAAGAGGRGCEEAAQGAAVAEPAGGKLECLAVGAAIRLVLRMGTPDSSLS